MKLSDSKLAALIARHQDILNLYIAYTNSGKPPDLFGREFFVAVGELLSGTTLTDLEVYHIPKPQTVVAVLPTKKGRKHG